MKLKLSLSQKALLLVAIPLSAELVFIAVLGVLLRQVEVEARKTERSRAIIGASSNITKLTFDACTNLVAYNLSKSAMFDSGYERSMKQIPQEIEFLRRVIGDDKEDLKALERMQKIATRAMSILNDSKKSADGERSALSILQGAGMKKEIEETVAELSNAVDAMVQRERRAQDTSPEFEARARGMVEIALVAGIILNLAIAICLTIVFNRSTSDRLKLLIDNTQRLARAEQLRPPVGGSDEISHLDGTFRDMAGALEESNRVRREFLEMVSHDVRTPLTSVTAILQMIEMGVQPERLSSDVSIARKNIDQVVGLLNELLDIHRLEAGKLDLNLVETGLAEILAESIDTVRPSAEATGVKITMADDPVGIRCDPDKLRQVFINLLSNALKFSPRGASIDTFFRVDSEQVKVIIRDQGPGVPDEFKTRIFDRFQQVRASDEKKLGGRGLGLAICKAIVEEHGGQIGVDDGPGGGSEFWVILPRRGPDAETSASLLLVHAKPPVV